ncbi:MAG TPA: GNAT family N-acetyltransferase [Streptosporangiaceae bacterium]
MLRVKPPWSTTVRLLDERDRGAVLAICDRDPVNNVFVSSRVRTLGLTPGRLGAQLWGHTSSGKLDSLCYSGANLVPVAATPEAIVAFADRALRQGRRCSSVVGPARELQGLWALLRPHWGPAREVRPVQPVLAMNGPPLVAADPLVRRVKPHEADILWPACVAMFTEEVGVSPTSGDGGASYRARMEQLIRAGRAFARIENGRVIFKAEIGAVTPQVCQVQGVWVNPEYRGQGLAAPGMAAVVNEAEASIAPVVSLYVNDFNLPARAAYKRVGFTDAGRFMSVLF